MAESAPEFWEPDRTSEAPSPADASASDSPQKRLDAQRAWRRHWEVLTLSAVVVAMAIALVVLPDQQHVALRGLEPYPLPHLCTARTWFGIKCPGCGLTRSLIHLAHGDWRASVRSHRLGWLMAIVVLTQFPYRVLSLQRIDRPLLGARATQATSLVIITLLISSWLFDLAVRRPPEGSFPNPTDRSIRRGE